MWPTRLWFYKTALWTQSGEVRTQEGRQGDVHEEHSCHSPGYREGAVPISLPQLPPKEERSTSHCPDLRNQAFPERSHLPPACRQVQEPRPILVQPLTHKRVVPLSCLPWRGAPEPGRTLSPVSFMMDCSFPCRYLTSISHTSLDP